MENYVWVAGQRVRVSYGFRGPPDAIVVVARVTPGGTAVLDDSRQVKIRPDGRQVGGSPGTRYRPATDADVAEIELAAKVQDVCWRMNSLRRDEHTFTAEECDTINAILTAARSRPRAS